MVQALATVPALKTLTKAQVVTMLHSNPLAVEHAIKALFARQTSDEQQSAATRHLNGKGFNSADASRCSFVVTDILGQGKHLRADTSKKYAQRLSKYAGQLASIGMLNMNKTLIADLEATIKEAREQAAEGGDIAHLAHAEEELRLVFKAINNPA